MQLLQENQWQVCGLLSFFLLHTSSSSQLSLYTTIPFPIINVGPNLVIIQMLMGMMITFYQLIYFMPRAKSGSTNKEVGKLHFLGLLGGLETGFYGLALPK